MALSPQEKERLINRPSNSHDRATNDVKVRKKLRAWLKDLPDMALIFHYLPKEQLRKELVDSHAFNLLDSGLRVMDCLDFNPIFGDADSPDMWYVPQSDGGQQTPTDQDIERSGWLSLSIEHLKNFYGNRNPVGDIIDLSLIYDNPRTRERLTNGEKSGIERVNRVMKKYEIKRKKEPPK
jgi:hypothetical protein